MGAAKDVQLHGRLSDEQIATSDAKRLEALKRETAEVLLRTAKALAERARNPEERDAAALGEAAASLYVAVDS